MPTTSVYVAAVSRRVVEIVGEPLTDLPDIATDTAAFLQPGRVLLAGGKRTRARLAALGWSCVRPGSVWDEPALVMAGSSLELFQAAALVHDDIIDDADTRRGNPAAHRHFAARHRDEDLRGDAGVFGASASMLLGDLLLSLGQREIGRAIRAEGPHAFRALEVWDQMTAEVAIGQYLDIEAAAIRLPPEGDDGAHRDALGRAFTVLRHKSAHYSVAHPLALGAALAGANEEVFSRLGGIAEPLGEAFQLRDDDLGIFGDPAITGKPAGDDLGEGKRTPLVLLGLSRTSGPERDRILAALGNDHLTDEEVEEARKCLVRCGAVAAHEAMIEERRGAALAAVDASGFDPAVRALLREVIDLLTTRDR